MRVAVIDDFLKVALNYGDWNAVKAKAELSIFTDHLADADAVVARLKDFEVICAMRERTPFPRAILERLPKLKLLVTSGKVNRSIDLQAATDLGIVVCGTDSGGNSTCELAWGLILAVARNIPANDADVRQGGWQIGVGMGLQGKTLGILGLGKIGGSAAKVGLAFGMKVIAWSQNLTEERCREVGVEKAASKEDLLKRADVVTIHMVLGDRSRGLIGAKEFAVMKPTAILVNTSRGPIVVQDDLLAALKAGKIGGAGIDVHDVEPLPTDHPMRSAPRTVLTPHLGYVSDDGYAFYYGQSADAVVAYLNGAPIRVMNPDVLKI
ncbi:MAG TPA: D-2-hydroxyacid dehydrogenase family protein [Alphaproteobacteria bacterium]|jgi:phosphoglycerate dehydrogenase-like enzyme